eukprot:snap_masked-scaffold_4-processed-gene-18.41-mRNA-1 protein AED:1.00 eAED:1.00 QI:0/0/0/0/1/1/2/0/65
MKKLDLEDTLGKKKEYLKAALSKIYTLLYMPYLRKLIKYFVVYSPLPSYTLLHTFTHCGCGSLNN